MSAEEYLRQSIVEPNYALAPVCPNGPCLPNIMPQDYGQRLTNEQIDAIVAYLLALDGTTVPENPTVIGDTAVFNKGGSVAKSGGAVVAGIDTSSASVQLIMIGIVLLLTLFLLWKRPYEEKE
jgi:hypothetical protein